MPFDLTLSRTSHIAQILSVLPGGYCAYGTWLTLHQNQTRAAHPDGVPVVTPPVNSTTFFIAFGAFVALLALGTILGAIASRQKRTTSLGDGLRVIAARWYCTVFPSNANEDVTRVIQGRVIGNTLQVHAHDNVLGDVCDRHKRAGFEKGHPKSLEVVISNGLHATATHDEWLTIEGVKRWPSHYGPEPPAESLATGGFSKQEVEQWKEKWEKERGGSSARDEIIKQLRAELEDKYPLVVPTSYDSHDFPRRKATKPGVEISNDGQSVAYDVRVMPFKIGLWDTSFDGLPRLEPNQKMPLVLYMQNGNHGYAELAEHLFELQRVAGNRGDPIGFTIAYRDSSNRWYKSFCEIRLDPTTPKGVAVKFLKRDLSAFAEAAL